MHGGGKQKKLALRFSAGGAGEASKLVFFSDDAWIAIIRNA
jgi:hypothetical protein